MAKKRRPGPQGKGAGRVVKPATTGAQELAAQELDAQARVQQLLLPLREQVDPQRLAREVLRRLTPGDLLAALVLTPFAAEALAPTAVPLHKRLTVAHGKALLEDLRTLPPPLQARDLLDVVVHQVDLLELAATDEDSMAWLLAGAPQGTAPFSHPDDLVLVRAWAHSPESIRLLAVTAGWLEGGLAGLAGLQWLAGLHPDLVVVDIDLPALRRDVAALLTGLVLEHAQEAVALEWAQGTPLEVLERAQEWARTELPRLHGAAHEAADLTDSLTALALEADERAAEAEGVIPALLQALTAATQDGRVRELDAQLRATKLQLEHAQQRASDAELAARHAQESSLAQATRDAQAELEQRVEGKVAAVLAGTPGLQQLRRELDAALAEAGTAGDELAAALADQVELAAMLDRTESRLRWWQSQVPEAVEPTEPAVIEVTGILDALEHAAALTMVEIGDTAGPAATLDAFGEVARVWGRKAWQVLQTLQDYAAAKRDGTWSGDLYRWLDGDAPSSATTFPRTWYAPLESDTVRTMERFRSARVFPVPEGVKAGGEAFMEAHVRLASGGEPGPRLHLHDDTGRPGGRIYVGYVGPHLPNSLTS
jgi:hypothetical protein